MSDIMTSTKYGIHTIELYAKNLKYIEVQKVIDHLMDKGWIEKMRGDSYNITRKFKSRYFLHVGLRLRIHQSYRKSNGIGLIINPSTLLTGKYQPVKLWVPAPESVELLQDDLSYILTELGMDFIDPQKLSLSRMDITKNIRLESGHAPSPDILLIRKGMVPRHFEVISNVDDIPKKRLYGMKTDDISIKFYDKIYELKRYDRCPKSLKNENILRYEVSLKREAFLEKLKLGRKDSLIKMLCTGYENGEDILKDYSGKIIPLTGEIVTYGAAKEQIERKVSDQLLREQMLYLLKKTSDSTGLSTATRKLKEHYTDVDRRRMKKIFSKFDELGIMPITLPKK